jgi:hypothetical protein
MGEKERTDRRREIEGKKREIEGGQYMRTV